MCVVCNCAGANCLCSLKLYHYLLAKGLRRMARKRYSDQDEVKAIESALILTVPHFQNGVGRSPIFTGNEKDYETDQDNLIVQWCLKDATENPGFLDINFQIKINHHPRLIDAIRKANASA